MMFLPGTHKKGHLRWKDSDKPAVLNQEIEDIESYGEPFHDELKAGQFSMHADMLAHGSEANNSDRRRCGLTIRYCSPDVRCVGERDWCNNAILCRGEDPFGHWTLKDRPKGENFAQNLTPIGAN